MDRMILKVIDVLFDSDLGLCVEAVLPPYFPNRLLIGKHISIAGYNYRVDRVEKDVVSVKLIVSPSSSPGVFIDLVY